MKHNTPHQPTQTSDWREDITFDNDWNDIFIKGKQLSYKHQLIRYISNLLSGQEKRHQREMEEARREVMDLVKQQINLRMRWYADTPLDERRNAFDELHKLETDLDQISQSINKIKSK